MSSASDDISDRLQRRLLSGTQIFLGGVVVTVLAVIGVFMFPDDRLPLVLPFAVGGTMLVVGGALAVTTVSQIGAEGLERERRRK